MQAIAFAYIASVVVTARHAHTLAVAAQAQAERLHAQNLAAAREAQQRQFAHDLQKVDHEQALAFAMRSWPLVNGPQALAQAFAAGSSGRPLLVLFAPPMQMQDAATIQRFDSSLKGFVADHFSSAPASIAFRTGYWAKGRELNDAAVAALQGLMPDQPMAVLGFALLPGEQVEPRFAYLPGPGGAATEVVSLCKSPIDIHSLRMNTERAHAGALQAASSTLRTAGFSEADLKELFGAARARNLLVERAERALRDAGCDTAVLGAGGELYSSGGISSADAEAALLQVLKIALGIVADAHNLLTRRMPPKLPDALEEITRHAPPVIAA
jgi:hypothetical protein